MMREAKRRCLAIAVAITQPEANIKQYYVGPVTPTLNQEKHFYKSLRWKPIQKSFMEKLVQKRLKRMSSSIIQWEVQPLLKK